ncbi:uncharacterized protein TNCV_1833281 [Trichonephila clavipes]|nr:uncharacterized protein TNCV_1833281 [Trichonephila clavipes]
MKIHSGRPSSIVVSDPDCFAVGPGFESRKRHGCCQCMGVLSRRVTSPLVRSELERWEETDRPQGVHPQNWGETELNRFVTCMVLRATANDRRHLALCLDEFRGP